MHNQDSGTTSNDRKPLSLIGFGEAAQAFVKGWRRDGFGGVISAYDLKTDGDDHVARMDILADYKTFDVFQRDSVTEVFEYANIAFSLVTADQAESVALEATKTLSPGTFYFDGNSCAPDTKRQNADVIEAAGGHYIDMAIMAPVHPKLHKTPILISGAKADQALEILTGLGMEARIEPGPVGRASAIKMTRSIMVKGMEALMAEAMLAGRRAGVEDVVLASLEKSWPGFDWRARAAYNLERMMVHGDRRAAEMREVVKTIDDLGLPSNMARATVEWQRAIGAMALAAGPDDLAARLDMVLNGLEKGKT
jgi:3-hydroxyisobutyrate dehydrogenase-like beta-hydroxyacid dehydrogenase